MIVNAPQAAENVISRVDVIRYSTPDARRLILTSIARGQVFRDNPTGPFISS